MEHTEAHQLLGIDPNANRDFAAISIASPETIRSWGYRNGEAQEVKNPETINYRTFKPEKGGLFCERIFGPTKDWECACGKYKRIKHKGVICDRCGVEVTQARVRRERMGIIELAVPVSHIWFFKCTPTRLGMVLDMTARSLERVLYYEDYIVVDPGDTPLQERQLLSELEMREAEDKYGEDAFVAKMGAEGVRDLMASLDMEAEIEVISEEIEATGSKQNLKKLTKRLKTIQAFLDPGTRPEWMILEVLPVIPPDLRPLVPLEGGRFATSDLNDLYRRVINRNNRLKNLLQLKTPDVIIRNEKRMLQEAVDALLDNGRHGRAVTGAGNRPLKSLSDMLKGKQGRFRQNLLGKRVDYSGRSVIVIGPELALSQCGLPKKMALSLFEPFIIRRLKEMGIVHTVRSAKKLIEREADEVWDILEEVTKGHTVLLNRAPTLHRLSIQAFEPVLIEGSAIRVHPLVCTAYNADFDGDQMAVHVPLSVEAQMETRLLMLASNNIFSPSSGKPITTPSQDICLGSYYITTASQRDRIAERTGRPEGEDPHLPLMNDAQEVYTAFDEGAVHMHSRIRLRNPDFERDTAYGDAKSSVIETTVGRVMFSQIWPDSLGFVNFCVNKKKLGELIWKCYQSAGHEETVQVLDRLKELGFDVATRSGISIGIIDMIIPDEKRQLLDSANDQLNEIEEQYQRGIITDGERYNKIVDLWTHTTEEITNVMFQAMEYNDNQEHINPIFVMVDSGARGSKQQIRQLAGMRGLMAKPSGEIIERPILSNFREGLTVLEYFISTHGARKGLADTALKTADSGYLTRKLVDVAHDIIVYEQDCGTTSGIEVRAIMEGDEELVTIGSRCIGRTSLDNVVDPLSKDIIVAAGQIIDERVAGKIDKAGIEVMKIRSGLTCESDRGICSKCYGVNPATGNPAALGESVGIIAAQSIGEPGTQLTMRTFHVGGVASSVFKNPEVAVKHDGVLKYIDVRAVRVTEEDRDELFTVLNKNGSIGIFDEDGRELERHTTMIGSQIYVPDGSRIKKGQPFMRWDPHNVPIISEKSGVIKSHDFIEGVTIRKEVDAGTGLEGTTVLEHKEDLHPQVIIADADSGETIVAYAIPSGAQVTVNADDKVYAGMSIAKTPRKAARTKDITGGLPRVAELFEARKPKEAAEIAKIDGVVDFEGSTRGKRRLIVRDPETGEAEEHLIPMGKHVVVFRGDHVIKGQQLTEGPVTPQELLEVCGPRALQEYLVDEVQSVYRLQGVEINDKHIEIIVRQMLRKVKITDSGDTDLLWGEQVESLTFEKVNKQAVAEGRRPAEATPVLLGITKAALETESFISAASFQDTTRVLTDAAALSKRDELQGFKENVIMGHLIPAGTGFEMYRNIRLKYHGETVSAEELLGDDFLEEQVIND